jgi:N4-gp56 family major capsid protein
MAAYTVQMTGTVEIPPAILTALNGSFRIAYADEDIIPRLAIRRMSADVNNIDFSFSRLTEIDSTVSAELLEYEDPASVPLAGSTSKVTAKEYGRVVTRTNLANVISGNALSREAATAVGRDAGRVENMLAFNTLAAGTNAMFAGAGTSAGLTTADVMSVSLMNTIYTRLSMAKATKDPLGFYTAILTPGQVLDLKQSTGAGSWNDVNKYTNLAGVLRGEIGSIAGFRVIESAMATPANQAGGPVDVHKAVFFGRDALGAGIVTPTSLRVTSSDKLNRFVNFGWLMVGVYTIIDQPQVYVANTSSSIGVNV